MCKSPIKSWFLGACLILGWWRPIDGIPLVVFFRLPNFEKHHPWLHHPRAASCTTAGRAISSPWQRKMSMLGLAQRLWVGLISQWSTGDSIGWGCYQLICLDMSWCFGVTELLSSPTDTCSSCSVVMASNKSQAHRQNVQRRLSKTSMASTRRMVRCSKWLYISGWWFQTWG